MGIRADSYSGQPYESNDTKIPLLAILSRSKPNVPGLIQQVTAEKWKKYFAHTHRLIMEAWAKEVGCSVPEVRPMIIRLQPGDASSDSSDCDGDIEHVSEVLPGAIS